MRRFDNKEKRVETGVVVFGDDWPGVFIRGDDCARFSLAISAILDGYDDVYSRYILGELAVLLNSSRVGGN